MGGGHPGLGYMWHPLVVQWGLKLDRSAPHLPPGASRLGFLDPYLNLFISKMFLAT